MVTKIRKWGNSQGLLLTKQVLEDAHITVGDDVDVTVRGGIIIVAPVRQVRGKRSLQELVSRIPKDRKADEIDWGRPVGKGVW
jgi:antitoxin MazE